MEDKNRHPLNKGSDELEGQGELISRRKFLVLLGFGAIFLGIGHIFRSSLFEFFNLKLKSSSAMIFPIGKYEEVLKKDGIRFDEKNKIFIETKNHRVRVQTAVCTHQGCIVNRVANGYACPCDGSTFDSHGKNTGGPARLPLVYFKVFKGKSGELMVNKTKTILDWNTAWYP